MARRTAATAPRGHNNTDAVRPTAAPRAMSSRRIRPTCQPVGWIRLKMMKTIMVNMVWPAMKEPTRET